MRGVRAIGTALLGACVLAGAPALAQAVSVERWCGVAHNITGGGRSGVEVTIERDSGGVTTAYGQWPDEGLYGRFKGEADWVAACEAGRTCTQFTGEFYGLEALGYGPDVTAASRIVIDAAVDQSEARAVYFIARFEGYPVDQYGVLDLAPCDEIA